MKKPMARPTQAKTSTSETVRTPRVFAPKPNTEIIETFSEEDAVDLTPTPQRRRGRWLRRILFTTAGILVSLGLGLAAEQLIRDLFARYEWLGWAGMVALVLFVLAVIALIVREITALLRLRSLNAMRAEAAAVLISDKGDDGRKLIGELEMLYATRADLARPRAALDADAKALLDGSDMVHMAERALMGPLDARAKALTAASARRVAIVTAISPRALVDIAFVGYESFKLARGIAELYGARPGLFGAWRLAGAILGHLAVTGGVALGDSVVQQLVGHGLAAKVSARLGEGLVNGLMTVRVGIAAMRVTRPLPFSALKQPVVMDFMTDLANIASKGGKT